MGPSEETLAVAVPTAGWPQPNDAHFPGSTPMAAGPPIAQSQARANGPRRPAPFVDKHYRSFLKAVSWRVTGTLDTIFISFLVTGQVRLAISIGFVELFTKIGFFYLHERIWTKIPLGRTPAPEDYAI